MVFHEFTFKALALLKLDAVPKLLAVALKAAQQELRKVGMRSDHFEIMHGIFKEGKTG